MNSDALDLIWITWVCWGWLPVVVIVAVLTYPMNSLYPVFNPQLDNIHFVYTLVAWLVPALFLFLLYDRQFWKEAKK
jgi:hypothetical protein